MSSNHETSVHQDDEIDLLEVFLALLNYWYVILACILLALAVAFFYISNAQPIYQVNGLLQVDNKQSGAAALLADSPIAALAQPSDAQAEIEIIRSRSTLLSVINQLNLDIELGPNNNGILAKLFGNEGKPVYDDSGLIYVSEKPKNTGQLKLVHLSLPESLQDKPIALVFDDNNSFTLKSIDEELGFQIKGYSGEFKKDVFQGSLYEVRLAFNGLKNESLVITQLNPNTAYAKLASELGVSEKGKQTGIIELNYSGTDPSHITKTLNRVLDVYVSNNLKQISLENQQTLAFLDKQLPELKKQLKDSEKRFNKFRESNKTINVDAESQVLLESSVEYEKRRSELLQKKVEISALYTDEFPLLKQINQQISVLNSKIGELQNRADKLPEIQRKYMQLFRDVEVNNELYTTLLQSYQELRVKQASETGNARIIDYAIKPIKPIKPKKLLIVLLAGILGTVLGSALALLIKMLTVGLRQTEELVAQTGIPVVANIPRSSVQSSLLNQHKGTHLLYLRNSQDPAIESLRSLRTHLLLGMASSDNNRLLVAGASPRIGKSFVTANLAAVIAQTGKKVLLIDADMRRGHLHKYLDVENDGGLSAGLNDKLALESLAKPTQVEGLYLINRGASPENPSELLMGDHFKAQLEIVSEAYDLVLLDSPPLLAVTDGAILASMVGMTYMLARYEQSKEKEVVLSIQRIEQYGGKVDGIVFNDIQKQIGTKYDYQYGYDYKSKKQK